LFHVITQSIAQDQWQRKKQSKEERVAARKAKLNPHNIKSAKDVIDERERKRKRELEAKNVEADNAIESQSKRQKTDDDMSHPSDSKSKLEKRKEKRERKKEKEAHRKEKDKEKQKRRRQKFKIEAKTKSIDVDSINQADEDSQSNDMEQIDVADLVEHPQDSDNDISSHNHSPAPESAFSHTSEQPPASSTSSPPPIGIESPIPIPDEKSTKSSIITITKLPRPNNIDIPKVDHDELKARLQMRIEALRTARKADGPDGRPARSRAELIESRRKKQEARKLHKKELRQAAKGEEQQVAAEAELARLRGSGSPMTNGSDLFSPSVGETSYSFGRIGFADGSHLSANGSIMDAPKPRGPMDARSALMAAEKKQERLGALDQSKREDIEAKDMWLNARKKIHGEHVRDEVSLLKKTLKRKEKVKAKSEKEWQAREEGVRKGKEARQRKREENLAKRKDEKGKGKRKSKGINKKLRNKAFGNLK
jgi:Surfeit locus protein 6